MYIESCSERSAKKDVRDFLRVTEGGPEFFLKMGTLNSFTRGGGPEFFCISQGETRSFLRIPRGGPDFFCTCQRGDQTKFVTCDPGKK